MNSRERVHRAVNFQIPDRVPIDLGGMKASGIAVSAYARLQKKLGLPGVARVLDTRFMIAVVEETVRQRFHLDIVPLDWSTVFSAIQPDSKWIPHRLHDGTEGLFPPDTRIQTEPDGSWVLLDARGVLTAYRMPKGGFYFDDTAFNRGGGIRPDKFKPVDSIPDEQLKVFSQYARHLYESTEWFATGRDDRPRFMG
ncbi:MAG: hypothetical protein AB1798_02200 [Spirochaetota bacterium]